MDRLISGQGLNLDHLYQFSRGGLRAQLAPEAREKVLTSRQWLAKQLSDGQVIYGVNTGFGAFSSVRIEESQIQELQRNLIRSHCAGVGPRFSPEQVRAIMILRANALARGHSGIRPEVIDKILEFYNHDILPIIPSQGSVGACGDLAPLAHLALGLIGEGRALYKGVEAAVPEILQKCGVQPLELQFKEGLSLINGCQVTTAIGMLALHEARRLTSLADAIGAMSLEALMGSRRAFDPLISASRPHAGEIKTASNLRRLLGDTSEIGESHRNCNRVQDAYSLRCMPAVHGAAKDTLLYVTSVSETEANSSTDNPLVFADDGKILSCGNFHGMPVAFAFDFASIAVAAIGSISEQRIAKMINPAMSGLPAFLTKHGGLNSGHMIVQVAAASLVSENKVLTHPASVDSIPTSADKEDHVSMGTIAARKFGSVVENVRNVLAMELLSAAQAIDLVRPLRTTQKLEHLHSEVRKRAPFAEHDRTFGEDVAQLSEWLKSTSILSDLSLDF